ncbi:hypothetical protein SDC9_181573 [bioreactor metagenome]|uniref:TM2 domain-containing protein n=1 Tax=bioreactor metagenome TaxID=1076179 RepID=A0A645H5V0_9ZZZZ
MKKSNFWTFICALIPGAGQMYLGMMQKGVSVMSLFFSVIFFSAFLRNDITLLFLPVIWFYSLFDTLNLRDLSEEERQARDNRFSLDLNGKLSDQWRSLLDKRHVWVGGLCIFFGVYLLFINFVRPYLYMLNDYYPWLYRLTDNLPILVVSLLIITLGIYMVKGNKGADKKATDFKEFKGDKHE